MLPKSSWNITLKIVRCNGSHSVTWTLFATITFKVISLRVHTNHNTSAMNWCILKESVFCECDQPPPLVIHSVISLVCKLNFRLGKEKEVKCIWWDEEQLLCCFFWQKLLHNEVVRELILSWAIHAVIPGPLVWTLCFFVCLSHNHVRTAIELSSIFVTRESDFLG